MEIALKRKISAMGISKTEYDRIKRLKMNFPSLTDATAILIGKCSDFFTFQHAPKFVTNDNAMHFLCACNMCREENILTPEQMKNHLTVKHAISDAFSWEDFIKSDNYSWRNLKEKCEFLSISYLSVISFRSKNNLNVDDDTLIEMYRASLKKNDERRKGYKEAREKAERLGLNFKSVQTTASQKNVSVNDAIDLLVKNKNTNSFRQKCFALGFDNTQYSVMANYRAKNRDLSDDEIIVWYTSEKPASFKEKCNMAKVNYSTARDIRRKEGISDEEAIEKAKVALGRREENRTARCKKAGVNARAVADYMRLHPEKSEEEVIDLYVAAKFFDFNIAQNKVFSIANEDYYKCTCKDCGTEDILSVKKMLEHKKNHNG